ncbi:MAG: adenylate cyclase regulatory domain-containing protein [Solirubrobacteraceae bacterium]
MDWEAEGLLEGLDGPQRDARIALLDTLESEGVPLEDIRRSGADGELLFLLAGRAIGVRVHFTWDELVEQSGLEPDLVERLVRAQGLTRAGPGEVSYTDADLQILKTTAEFIQAGVPEPDIVHVGRVLGRGFSQAAEVMRGIAMEIVLEPGLDERELAVRYAHAAGALTPMIEPLLGNLMRLHLSKLVQTEIISAEEREAGMLPGARQMTVAFADLVGFTRLGEQVPPDELGAVASRLELIVLDLIEPPVRFVKTIGDAVMVVSPEPDAMIEVALRMVEAADAEGESFPQLRAGLASGEALSRAGDWFGRPVNLASRVTTVARPGSVLTTEDVQDAAPDLYRWSKAGVRKLRGIDGAVPLWRARRAEPASD